MTLSELSKLFIHTMVSDMKYKVSFGVSTEPEILLGHLDDFIKRNDKLVKDPNGYIRFFDQLKEQGTDCTYSRLMALSGVYTYSAMSNWGCQGQKIISKKEAECDEAKGS